VIILLSSTNSAAISAAIAHPKGAATVALNKAHGDPAAHHRRRLAISVCRPNRARAQSRPRDRTVRPNVLEPRALRGLQTVTGAVYSMPSMVIVMVFIVFLCRFLIVYK